MTEHSKNSVKLSVLVITYNHENFLAQALDSILMQEVDFNYEIVIGEDCSTDATRTIAMRYRQKYPEKVRLLLHDKNLGMNKNFIQTLQACRGEYVACLDGDDYWTSSKKLQYQVDFLEMHPECSLSFHHVSVSFEDGRQEPWRYLPPNPKEFFTVEDLFTHNCIPISAVVFRRDRLRDIPEQFLSLALGDFPLFLLLAHRGSMGLLKQPMGVYRFLSSGTWPKKSEELRTGMAVDTFELLYELITMRFNSKQDREAASIRAFCCLKLAYLYFEERPDLAKAKKYALRCLFLNGFYKGKPLKTRRWWHRKLWNVLLKLYLPPWLKPPLKALRTSFLLICDRFKKCYNDGFKDVATPTANDCGEAHS